jgi:hypothetical protein
MRHANRGLVAAATLVAFVALGASCLGVEGGEASAFAQSRRATATAPEAQGQGVLASNPGSRKAVAAAAHRPSLDHDISGVTPAREGGCAHGGDRAAGAVRALPALARGWTRLAGRGPPIVTA